MKKKSKQKYGSVQRKEDYQFLLKRKWKKCSLCFHHKDCRNALFATEWPRQSKFIHSDKEENICLCDQGCNDTVFKVVNFLKISIEKWIANCYPNDGFQSSGGNSWITIWFASFAFLLATLFSPNSFLSLLLLMKVLFIKAECISAKPKIILNLECWDAYIRVIHEISL